MPRSGSGGYQHLPDKRPVIVCTRGSGRCDAAGGFWNIRVRLKTLSVPR